MKTISTFKRFWIVAILLAAILPVSAQFKFGPRLGVEVNSLHLDKSTFDASNRAGFTGGLQAEFTVPLIGVGADVSVMYAHRTSQWFRDNELDKINQDYIEIPLNLKYKLSLPAISHIIAPYVFTGPSFSLRCSKEIIDDLKSRTCDVAWNFGLGIQLIDHLQVGASYGIGMTKPFQMLGLTGDKADIEGKNRYWTITAAWLF